uniref:Uncharacterized protein n=1 Tax=Oryza barthii TaxID=65489 RepID=A0A0D3EM36_9ORYZ
MEINYYYYKLIFRFSLHFSLSSIGDDEQPTTMEINYYYYKVGGIAALSTALLARQHDLCISVVECTRFLAGSVLAVFVGVLALSSH